MSGGSVDAVTTVAVVEDDTDILAAVGPWPSHPRAATTVEKTYKGSLGTLSR